VVKPITPTWTGYCPPPTDATKFELDFTVTGTLPGVISIPYKWHTVNNHVGTGTSSVPATFRIAGTQAYPYTESFATSTNDNLVVDWSAPNGQKGTTTGVPVTITCKFIG
jgi:hypothetical protein